MSDNDVNGSGFVGVVVIWCIVGGVGGLSVLRLWWLRKFRICVYVV